MQIYDFFCNNPLKMVEIMAAMVIVGTGFIHSLRVNISCQYLIGGLSIYGELI